MANDTARLALPLIETGQAQKEMAHNEALALIDIATQASVEAVGTNAPPAAPLPGQCWVVGTAPTGDWAGHAGAVAGWTAGGWRFVAARVGLRVWNRATAQFAVRGETTWEDGVVRGSRLSVAGQQVVGARQPAVAAPAGGSVIDAEARTAIGNMLAAMRTHGLISPS